MANIGTFKKSGQEFLGEIVTLSVQTKGVRIVPETGRNGDTAPSHRIYVGRAEIGAAWSKRSNEGRDYLSVKLDDPSFNAPIYANLFNDEDGETFTLIWSRSRKPNGDRPLGPRCITPRPDTAETGRGRTIEQNLLLSGSANSAAGHCGKEMPGDADATSCRAASKPARPPGEE